MGSRFNGVPISAAKIAPKAALSYNTASSGIRAPLTVDESDFEYSGSSKSRRNSTTSSYYSGSEPESEGFASGEDEGILDHTRYVEGYASYAPSLQNPDGEMVEKSSRSYEDALFRPSLRSHWKEIAEESGSSTGDVFLRAYIRNPNERNHKGFKKFNEYDDTVPSSSDSDDEIFGGDHVLGNGDFRPFVAAANEETSENESSSVVDMEISLMPKSKIPIAQVSRDSDDDSQDSEVLEDDGFSGVARVPGIELQVRSVEAHESVSESMINTDVEDLVASGQCLGLKDEKQTIDGVVSADTIQDKDLDTSYEVSVGSLVPHEEHKSLSESEQNGDLVPLDREIKETDVIGDEKNFLTLDSHGLPTDLAKDTTLPGSFPCDISTAEPRWAGEVANFMELEIPDLENSSAMVEAYVDYFVSDKNMEQKCDQEIDQTVETNTTVTLDQGVQMNEGLSEGCPQFPNLAEVYINSQHISQETPCKPEKSEQLHIEVEHPTLPADSNAMVADTQDFISFSGEEILRDLSLKIDGQMATGLNALRQISDSADLEENIGVVSDDDMDQLTSFESRKSSEQEETLSEKEKHELDKIQQIRVKYLQLLRSLGMLPGNFIAAVVLQQLAAAETRSCSQGFNFDSDKKDAIELQVQSENDLNFSLSILVIGKTGVGKSATINSIFGEKKTLIDAFEPATTDVKEIIGMINGVRVKVYDTPGLRTSHVDQSHNRKVLLSIKRLMQESPPNVVLYVDRLDVQTNNFDDLPLLKLVTDYLGSSIWQNTIISFTHSSSILPDGSNGDPLSYEVFVSQRSYSVQQMISHSCRDYLVRNHGLMIPVALVENHACDEKSKYGEKSMHRGECWRSQLMLLFYSMKTLSEVHSMAKIQNPLDHGNLFGFKILTPFDQEDDTSAGKETGSSESVAVRVPDAALPPSLDGSNLSFKYYPFASLSQFPGEPDFDSHGWDHDFGYDSKFQALVSVQHTKDTKECSILLRPSVSPRHKYERSTMAGVNIQTAEDPATYVLKGESEIKNFKMSKTADGVSIYFLEDQITVGKELVLTGNAGSCQTKQNAANGASIEVLLRGKIIPILNNQRSLGLSSMKWRGNVIWGCNLQTQFSVGRSSRVCVQASLNNKESGRLLIRTSGSDQLQLTVIAFLPIAKAILRSIFT